MNRKMRSKLRAYTPAVDMIHTIENGYHCYEGESGFKVCMKFPVVHEELIIDAV